MISLLFGVVSGAWADTATLTVTVTPSAPSPACGDGSCNGSETCSSCPGDCGNCPSGGGRSGGGGGGSSVIAPTTNVVFAGRAYPLSKVGLLKDGQLTVTTVAGPDANFNISLSGLSSGSYLFSVFSEDNQGQRSILFTFPIYITQGATTQVSGIFIAPTIAVDKSEIKRGENIAIFGQSVPQAEITIQVNSEQDFFGKTSSDDSGAYLYNFDTAVLEMGQHLTKSKAGLDGAISSFSKAISFIVGNKTILNQPTQFLKGDLNDDNRVNLIDFSIAAYWYKRSISPEFIQKEAERLNSDGKLDLIDFSIMAYYWTG